MDAASDFTLPPAQKDAAGGSVFSGGFTEPVGESGAHGPSSGSHSCKDKRRFSFRLHRPRGARIVRVTVYVNGHRVKRLRGHRITHFTLKRLPRGVFKVKIVTVSSRGSRTVSVRTYRGCRKGRPHRIHRHGHGH